MIQIDSNFQTPPGICDYMVSLIPKKCKRILEPTPGHGNLFRALFKKGFDVYHCGDFFQLDKELRFDAIVMNPPFSSHQTDLTNAPTNINLKGLRVGYYILKQCMDMSENIIALMPWFTIADSDVRVRELKAFGLVSITYLPRKTFQYARIQTVIVVLKKGHKGKTEFITSLI